MRRSVTVTTIVLLASLPCFAQDGLHSTTDNRAVVAAAQKAAVEALNFRQGDAAGFSRARSGFSEAGWTEFMKKMAGFLDGRGAPTFTSTFVARETRIIGEQDGVTHLKIPGSLTQSNQLGKTTYQHFAIDVYVVRDADDNTIKIQRLDQTTCVGASTACN